MNQRAVSNSNESAAFLAAMQEAQRVGEHYADAPARFLNAWKKAVEMIGPEYFHCEVFEDCAIATNREKLRPDTQAIERYLSVCSVGQGVFIGAVISFFNGDWGAEISSSFGYSGLGDIANRLDLNELEVIIELMQSHTGW